MKNNNICEICNCEQMALSFRYNEDIAYFRCPNCDFLKRIPSKLELNYHTEYMNYDVIPKSRRLAENYYKRFSGIIPEGSRCLDFGGSFGIFCSLLAKRKNAIVRNVELSNIAADYARKNNVPSYKTIGELDIKQYDFIFSFHLLEHLEPNDIKPNIENLMNILADGGKLIILTPNSNAFKLKLFKKYYSWLAPEQHISFLSSKSVKYLFEKYENIEFTADSEMPSFYHYPSNSIVSAIRKKIYDKKIVHYSKPIESLQDKSQEELTLPKRLVLLAKAGYANMLLLESMILHPIYRLLEAFRKERDELIGIIRKIP